MKVRSSTRATSVGSVRAQNELGLIFWSSRTKVPASTSASVSRVHSSSEPVHQCTASGVVSSATSLTHDRMPWCVVGAGSDWLAFASTDAVSAVITYRSLSRIHGDGKPATGHRACRWWCRGVFVVIRRVLAAKWCALNVRPW